MKLSALDVYVCPACRGRLDLRGEVRSTDAPEEVAEGTLACPSCGTHYPIVRGVPRFVADGAYATSFGRQWRWFRSVQMDSATGQHLSSRTFTAATGWAGDALRGRRVLDAGVGAGRFAECAANQGAELFGVDLTLAVDAAYENIGARPRVHLAQADIFHLPFRDATFDAAYSIGVLHHTPDTEAAFTRVAATVRPYGEFAVYLYARYGPSHHFSDLWRVVTTRLPPRFMFFASGVAIPLYFVYRIPGVGSLLNVVAPISMEPRWRWRWLDTFDWYTPKYQWKYLYPEVFRWFAHNGFHDVVLYDDPIRMKGVKGVSARDGATALSRRVVAS